MSKKTEELRQLILKHLPHGVDPNVDPSEPGYKLKMPSGKIFTFSHIVSYSMSGNLIDEYYQSLWRNCPYDYGETVSYDDIIKLIDHLRRLAQEPEFKFDDSAESAVA
jgi:hypothetical protein